MLKNVKRTKNNDLILNDKGLSVLNILCILSIWIALFFFIPVAKEKKIYIGRKNIKTDKITTKSVEISDSDIWRVIATKIRKTIIATIIPIIIPAGLETFEARSS